MKKFTLTLLLLLAGIPTLFAQQTVRNDIFAYLKHEGYALSAMTCCSSASSTPSG